ncbi:MAG TPA: isocitrate lyase/phosphoenolpyruvate mutase family protein [Geminicoccaceae bacterium]|nr:isocitrate lyase/phosphoenolpyruvate mutase family protein [Geminicoccaceae bacterium]
MTVSQVEKANAFRALHEGPGAFVIPNPYDVGTARILAGLGFQALATTSAGCAFGLGRREGAMTRDEALAHARAIVEATPLPVSADLENGFGDAPETVAETVRLAAETGLAGCSIEDATGNPDRPIYEFAQAVERVAAAVEAARALPFRFTLTARAENFLHGRPDLDDTISRLQAFEAAGADVLYAPGPSEFEPIRRICSALEKPVNMIGGLGPTPLTVEQLAAAGVRRISVGSALARIALGAFLDAAREVKAQGSFSFTSRCASFKEIEAFMPGRSS